MSTALRAADTGHLVFSTMHTSNASETVQRLIATFPEDERELVLMQLATNLEAVICQRLAKAVDGGRLPGCGLPGAQPALADRRYCIENVELCENGSGRMTAMLYRADGGRDVVFRRKNIPDAEPETIEGFTFNGDVGVASFDGFGNVEATLDVRSETP